MRKLQPYAVGVFVLITATRLDAQAIQSPYEFIETTHTLTAYAGYISTHTGSADLAPRSAPLFGGRYNLHFSGPLSGEVGVGFAPSERTLYRSPAAGAEPEALGDISAIMMLMELGLRFGLTGPRTWNGFAPFTALTIGLVADVSRLHEIERELPAEQLFEFGPGFAAGLGLGTNYFLSERFSLRGDVRDHLWRLTTPAGLRATGQRETEWRHNFSFTFGGAYHF